MSVVIIWFGNSDFTLWESHSVLFSKSIIYSFYIFRGRGLTKESWHAKICNSFHFHFPRVLPASSSIPILKICYTSLSPVLMVLCICMDCFLCAVPAIYVCCCDTRFCLSHVIDLKLRIFKHSQELKSKFTYWSKIKDIFD